MSAPNVEEKSVDSSSQAAGLRRNRHDLVRGLSLLREYGIIFSFAALFIILTVSSPVFFSRQNFINILDQSAPLGIIACATTLVIISGGFDLSVGAVYALSGIAAAEVAIHVGTPASWFAGALLGGLIGIANGFLVVGGRFNSFIATLASQYIIYGIAVVVTGGLIVVVADNSFTKLGRGTLFGISYVTYAWLATALACGFILSMTKFGRYIYAVGGNAVAARLSGVPVGSVRIAVFGISGLGAGIAGVFAASRIQSGQPNVGIGFEFAAIAAIAIGGTSIFGGAGAIWRTVLGVLLLSLIRNGFNLLGVNPIYQQVVQGIIILVAVAMDAWLRPRNV